jgi:hypothetical protein
VHDIGVSMSAFGDTVTLENETNFSVLSRGMSVL